jgi:hypothetical protein
LLDIVPLGLLVARLLGGETVPMPGSGALLLEEAVDEVAFAEPPETLFCDEANEDSAKLAFQAMLVGALEYAPVYVPYKANVAGRDDVAEAENGPNALESS